MKIYLATDHAGFAAKEKVKEANELIAVCEVKLRGIERDVNDGINAATKQSNKKDEK